MIIGQKELVPIPIIVSDFRVIMVSRRVMSCIELIDVASICLGESRAVDSGVNTIRHREAVGTKICLGVAALDSLVVIMRQNTFRRE